MNRPRRAYVLPGRWRRRHRTNSTRSSIPLRRNTSACSARRLGMLAPALPSPRRGSWPNPWARSRAPRGRV